MSISVEMPPAPIGTAEQQLRQLYGYLFRMAEQLNVAAVSVGSGGSFVKTAGSSVKAGAGTPNGTAAPDGALYEELRALIINTAELLRKEMDTLELTLQGSFEAISSQWGVYREQMQANIVATAEGVLQSYGYDAAIEALQSQAAGFEAYRLHTEGFIRQGFIDRDANGVPIIGIAIGQGLTGTEVEVDGQTVTQLDPTVSCAFYTADRVSFRINGQEAAYLSNRRLYVGDVEITGRMTLGSWIVEDGAKGLSVKWIGG